jgi:hypothetical protein
VQRVLPDGGLPDAPVLAQERQVRVEQARLRGLDARWPGHCRPDHADVAQPFEEEREGASASMHGSRLVHPHAAPGPIARDRVQECLDVGLAEVAQLDAALGRESAELQPGVQVAADADARIAERRQLPDEVVEIRPDERCGAMALGRRRLTEELLDHVRLLAAGFSRRRRAGYGARYGEYRSADRAGNGPCADPGPHNPTRTI